MRYPSLQKFCDALVGWWPAFQDWLTEKHLAWGIPAAITGLLLPVFVVTTNLQKLYDADRSLEVDSRIQTRYRSQLAKIDTEASASPAEKPRVVVALVDEIAIRADPRLATPSPLSRAWLADFVTVCRRGGAAAVAIDFTLDTPDSRETLHKKDTDLLAAALKGARTAMPPMPVILAARSFSTTYCGQARNLILLPEEALLTAAQVAPAAGNAGLSDSVIRDVPFAITGSQGTQVAMDSCSQAIYSSDPQKHGEDKKEIEEQKKIGNAVMLPVLLAADYRQRSDKQFPAQSLPQPGQSILLRADQVKKLRSYFFGSAKEDKILVDFALPPGKPDGVEVVSAQQLFRYAKEDATDKKRKDQKLKAWLGGRVVVVGAGYQKSEDWQETPLSTPYFGIFKAKGQKMAGTEIMGRATASLLAATAPQANKQDFWELLSVDQYLAEVGVGVGMGLVTAVLLWLVSLWLRSPWAVKLLAWTKEEWGPTFANFVCVAAFVIALGGVCLVFYPLLGDVPEIRFPSRGWAMMGGALLVFAPFSGTALRSPAWIMMASWLGAFGWTAYCLTIYLPDTNYEYAPLIRPILGIFLGGMVMMLFWRRQEASDKEQKLIQDSQVAKESLVSDLAATLAATLAGVEEPSATPQHSRASGDIGRL